MNDAPATSHEYPAPPAYRPLSGGAITALILSIVMALFAFMGPWWIEVIPLAIAAISWGAIADGRRRGAGVAIAACIIALLAGGGAFLAVRAYVHGFEGSFEKLLTALDKDDRAELAPWVLKGEDPKATMDAWHARYDAAKGELGAPAGSPIVRSGLWGPWTSLFVPPEGATEVAPPPGTTEPVPQLGNAMWFEAPFARERAYVALVWAKDGTRADLKPGTEGALVIPFRELRFFRAKPAAK